MVCTNLYLQRFRKQSMDIRTRFDALMERILREHQEAISRRIQDKTTLFTWYRELGAGEGCAQVTSLAVNEVHVTLGSMIQCFDWKAGKDGNLDSVDMEEDAAVGVFWLFDDGQDDGSRMGVEYADQMECIQEHAAADVANSAPYSLVPFLLASFSARIRRRQNYQEESFTHKEEIAHMALSDSENEVIFGDKIVVLKRDVSFKDSDISWLKSELEKVKLEKESYQLKIKNFENASKSLDQLLGSQIIDKCRKGVGFVSYNAVPPLHTGFFSPLKIDLSNSGLEEFQEPEFESYGPKTSKSASEDISNEVRKSKDAPLVEKLVLDDKSEKKIVFPTVAKTEFIKSKQQEKPVRKPVKSGPISLNTARQSHFNAVRTNQVNAVKASACWVWRPIKPNRASITLKRYDYVDVRGRSRSSQAYNLVLAQDTCKYAKRAEKLPVQLCSLVHDERELVKKNKGKEPVSHQETEEKESDTDSKPVVTLTGSLVESSKHKKLKQFNFVTEEGKHVYLTADQIKEQKRVEDEAKAEIAKRKVEEGKEEWIDLLGVDVVTKYYKAKLQSTKKFKSSVSYKDNPAGTVLNEPILGMILFNSFQRQDFVTIKDFEDFSNEILYTIQEIFLRLHQGPGLDDHARTFSSFLLAKVDKKNLNPLKQMGTIEQLVFAEDTSALVLRVLRRLRLSSLQFMWRIRN
ncbi:hypothetical protein Tco_1506489 [Tanacetum coccineum]